MKKTPTHDRFDDKWTPEPYTNCWLWFACISGNNSYGAIRHNGKATLAHRVSWEMRNGPIPAGMHVLHRCDTPTCVNPDHLFLGTPLDNARDRDAKGRRVAPSGKTHWHYRRKLTINE
jgi:hypothetical protein